MEIKIGRKGEEQLKTDIYVIILICKTRAAFCRLWGEYSTKPIRDFLTCLSLICTYPNA